MRLFEIVSPTFYLCTSADLKIGNVATPSSVYPLGATIENMIENRRPEDCLPRDNSLYLRTEPCGNTPYVYLVQPIGQMDRHHTSWLKKLAGANIRNAGEIDSYATGYWSGKPFPDDQNAPFEYRTASAKVLKRVGGTELMLTA